jgi:hypothetical protein
LSALGLLLALVAASAARAVPAASSPATADAQWNRGVHDSCLPAETKAGVTAPVAEHYCSCIVRVLDEIPLGARTIMKPDSPLIGEAAAFCRGGGGVPTNLAAQSHAWDRSTYSGCTASTERAGQLATVARSYCACVVRVLGELPAEQKLAITGESPEINAASDICRTATPR